MGKSLRKKGSISRRTGFREQLPSILIVCEGEKTEKYYFDDLKRKWNISTVDVKIIPLGAEPKAIVEEAKKEYSRIHKSSRDMKKHHVWCVFDRDDHERWSEAMEMARANGFSIAASNPNFELWYLLHFEYQSAHIERDDVIHKLKYGNIPGYEKNMENLFGRLQPNLSTAIGNAEKLRIKHEGDGRKRTENPSTAVDELVRFLENHAKRLDGRK